MAITDAQIRRNRKVWTDALRSGEYKQGEGQLASYEYDSFCCLGVACEVLGAKYGVRRELEHADTTQAGMYGYDNPYATRDGWEPDVIHEFGGLPDPLFLPLGLSQHEQSMLAEMNDGTGEHQKETFAGIADYIDQLPITRSRYADTD